MRFDREVIYLEWKQGMLAGAGCSVLLPFGLFFYLWHAHRYIYSLHFENELVSGKYFEIYEAISFKMDGQNSHVARSRDCCEQASHSEKKYYLSGSSRHKRCTSCTASLVLPLAESHSHVISENTPPHPTPIPR
jgi:hypothetical protein